MTDIVVFGSIVQDLISYCERFPRPGESVRGKSFESGAGGKGANQAAQAARLGANVVMIGRVGNDIFGPLNVENLKSSGVVTNYIEMSPTTGTGTATITVSEEGENAIVVTLGANLELSPERADEMEDVIATAKIILCQYEIPFASVEHAFEIAKKHNVKTFFNFAPGSQEFNTRCLTLVDYLCTNENETEFLSKQKVDGVNDAMRAAEMMLSLGPKAIIVTLGPRGVVLADQRGVRHITVPQVKAVDTTGAGDCFCGSLAFFMVKMPNLSLEEQVRRAVFIASITVQKKGTQASYPWARDLPEEIPRSWLLSLYKETEQTFCMYCRLLVLRILSSTSTAQVTVA
ncbi:hypothetical protein AB6A40_002830 [Gnathostoma spinigerum]|uniref:Ribokinase n=1 Tax=Gnathostoma spinigerum TaxID=75299 RepID=A0ABD6EFD2_9BILA